MPNLYMLCGVPTSGKTTFREVKFNKVDYYHLSTDDYINKIATALDSRYHTVWKDAIDLATSHLHRNLEYAMASRKYTSIVWDQTNLTVKSRIKKLTHIKQLERKHSTCYHKIIYFFPSPTPDEIQKRLAHRGEEWKSFWSKVEPMLLQFEVPTLEEGWDEVRQYHGDI